MFLKQAKHEIIAKALSLEQGYSICQPLVVREGVTIQEVTKLANRTLKLDQPCLDTYYLLGTMVDVRPYPTMVRDYYS